MSDLLNLKRLTEVVGNYLHKKLSPKGLGYVLLIVPSGAPVRFVSNIKHDEVPKVLRQVADEWNNQTQH